MAPVEAVFVGVATIDALAVVDRFPRQDERVLASTVMYAGGGPAATSAVAAARLGIAAAFVGTVGDDANGRLIIDGLTAEGVDVSGVTIEAGAASSASAVIIDRSQGTRAICNRPGEGTIDLTHARPLLTGTPVVHVDQVGWGPVAGSELLAEGQLLSVDAGNPIPGFTPRGVGLYAPTLEALRRDYGDLSVDDLLDAALADGCEIVVATDGSRGSYAATRRGERAAAPAHRVDVVSTLGAGDVFHGALVAAYVRGFPLAEQLRRANAVAALSCRGVDGRSRIPTLDELESVLAAHPIP